MKTLIIPDVHQRVYQVEKALNGVEYDKVVFLGDWFDSFYQPPLVSGFEATCIFLRELISSHPRRDDFTFLVGNHDINYIFNNTSARGHRHIKNNHYYASGYTQNKCAHFRKTFFENGLKDSFFIENFKIAHFEQGWLLSHAGFIPESIPYGRDITWHVDVLLPDVWENFRNIYHPRNTAICSVGVARGGRDAFGGPLWLDWNDEMYADPLVGNQIVGHTTLSQPGNYIHVGENEKETVCWNLDTCLHYGILIDGAFTHHKYSEIP